MPDYERPPKDKETTKAETPTAGQDQNAFRFFMAWLLLFMMFGCLLAVSLLAAR